MKLKTEFQDNHPPLCVLSTPQAASDFADKYLEPGKMRKIIAIHGKIGSGKSTVAGHICRTQPAVAKPFAGPLKDFALKLGWNGKKDIKGRRLLQLIGTECGRECIDEQIWIHKWRESLDNTGSLITVVVDDVRFQNEYDELVRMSKDGEAEVIFLDIHRPSAKCYTPTEKLISFVTQLLNPVHKSEQGIKYLPTRQPNYIVNDGTIEKLLKEVDMYVG